MPGSRFKRLRSAQGSLKISKCTVRPIGQSSVGGSQHQESLAPKDGSETCPKLASAARVLVNSQLPPPTFCNIRVEVCGVRLISQEENAKMEDEALIPQ